LPRRLGASSVAFTGAFDITSAREGRLVKVGGVASKCRAALEKGLRFIFLPQGNETDIDLSLQKHAEREGFGLSFISSISEACQEIFGDSRKKSNMEIAREVLSDLRGILTFRPTKSLLKQNIVHIWASTLLLTLMYFIEGLLVYKIASIPPMPWTVFYRTVIPACLAVFIAILLSYAIIPSYLEQRRQDSWYASMGFFLAASIVVYLLLMQTVRGETPDISRLPDWPPALGLLKDLFIFLAFAVLYLTNIFNYIAALDFLSRRYQVITVQNCLNKSSLIDTDVPVRLIRITWQFALIAAFMVAAVLLSFEMVTFWSLREGLEATHWYIVLGVLRNLVFLVVALEVIIWYRNSLNSLSRRITEV
jgi:hypothetical protein